MNKDWTEKLRERLAEHEVAAKNDLWAGIEARIEAAQPLGHAKERPAARTMALRRWSVAAAVALLLAGGGVALLGPKGDDTMLPGSENHEGMVATNPAPNHENLLAHADTPQNPVSKGRLRDTHPTEASTAATAETAPTQEATATEQGQQRESIMQDHQPQTASHPNERVSYRPTRREVLRTERDQKVTLGLYAMNGFGKQQAQNAVLMNQSMAQSYNQLSNYGTAVRQGSPRIMLTNFSEEINHHVPLSVGLSVGYGLGGHWAVQTGLTYTRGESEFVSRMNNSVVTTVQRLHYVGVPVLLRYDFWHWQGLKTYVAAGGQMDVNVKAERRTEGVKVDMDRDRVQWSLTGLVGAQYNVMPQVGVFGEVGARWYPDNGSRVENYFKDKPVGMSVQMGVRLNM